MGSVSRPATPPFHSSPLFNSEKHLAYQPPSSILSLEDIHLQPSPISPVASSVPFPLLSPKAVEAHRAELFSKPVLSNCLWRKRTGAAQIRGMAPRYAPFIHQFWTSPEVLGIISAIAGVDLVPVVDYEICHTNVQLGEEGLDGVWHTPAVPPEPTEEERTGFEERRGEGENEEAEKAIVPWHRDSHPFVCVVMLSNAEFMMGGETELQNGDGTTMKVRSPQMGHAVVLQGRSVSHIARPAGNMKERITIVTSFRPRDPMLYDDSSNMNIRSISQHSEIYYQWSRYRLELLSKRFAIEAEELKRKYEQNIRETDPERKTGFCRTETVDVDGLKKFIAQQTRYMERTLFEMRPIEAADNFVKNEIPQTPDEGLVV